MTRNTTRTPPPRQLGSSETLESLLHWKTTFRTFYKKDEAFKRFFRVGTTWNPNNNNYGLVDDENDERDVEELSEDLSDLLHTLASYLPHAYLTDKIVKTTTCWDDVWGVINDHYNVQVTSETLLDFESLHKQESETHRQFYERLLQHAKQHLAPANVKVENHVNATADRMSISLMNFIALQWLRKVNPSLVNIVRTEYSTELRSNTQLAELVPRIAPNIDSLLQRYDAKGNVGNIHLVESDPDVKVLVNKTWNAKQSSYKTDRNAKSSRSWDKKEDNRSARKSGPFCPGCYYLSQQLKTTLHFKHTPGDCPRKAVTLKMLQMEDDWLFNELSLEDNATEGKNEHQKKAILNPIKPFQIPKVNEKEGHITSAETMSSEKCSVLVETELSDTPKTNSVLDPSQVEHISDNKAHSLRAQILRLQKRQEISYDSEVKKARSPAIWVTLLHSKAQAVIDEGSEINCLDYTYVKRNGISYIPTNCVAQAAGANRMKLAGETKDCIMLTLLNTVAPVILNLGKMIVVKNLGVDILIGEPGKADNEILTLPHKQQIEFKSTEGKKITVSYSTKWLPNSVCAVMCKSEQTQAIYPGHRIQIEIPFNL